MRWKDIAAFFCSQGKSMDHASAMHLVKMFPIYKRDNKDLGEFELNIINDSKLSSVIMRNTKLSSLNENVFVN